MLVDLAGNPINPKGDLRIEVQRLEVTTRQDLNMGRPAQYRPGLRTCYIGDQAVSVETYTQEFIRRYGHAPQL